MRNPKHVAKHQERYEILKELLTIEGNNITFENLKNQRELSEKYNAYKCQNIADQTHKLACQELIGVYESMIANEVIPLKQGFSSLMGLRESYENLNRLTNLVEQFDLMILDKHDRIILAQVYLQLNQLNKAQQVSLSLFPELASIQETVPKFQINHNFQNEIQNLLWQIGNHQKSLVVLDAIESQLSQEWFEKAKNAHESYVKTLSPDDIHISGIENEEERERLEQEMYEQRLNFHDPRPEIARVFAELRLQLYIILDNKIEIKRLCEKLECDLHSEVILLETNSKDNTIDLALLIERYQGELEQLDCTDISSECTRLHIQIATSYHWLGEHKKALELYKNIDPEPLSEEKHRQQWLVRAKVALATQQMDLAKNYFDEWRYFTKVLVRRNSAPCCSYANDPTNIYKKDLADMLLLLGKLDDAEKHYQELQEIYTDSALGFLGLARVAEERGNITLYEQHLKQAAKYNDVNGLKKLDEAIMLCDTGKVLKAIAIYQETKQLLNSHELLNLDSWYCQYGYPDKFFP